MFKRFDDDLKKILNAAYKIAVAEEAEEVTVAHVQRAIAEGGK